MLLTPLELFFGSTLVSVFTAFGVRACMARQFVTREEFRRLEKTMGVFTPMVRALIVYSDKIPDETKAELLNGNGRD
ncbi:hypothetical protein GGQ74_000084 [Desulfobaculum xiamenense]|uniref:Uncharacterized protein n=1 Tax=Desulfobaculum xiamenense TaxID=995050 RepID=A0A846QMG4_9BACT|nr:hypothetical protein [Desulfobaculum xiamenense]NJB66444.1 hypothetical protein [Desulfobaculum xiamenense]